MNTPIPEQNPMGTSGAECRGQDLNLPATADFLAGPRLARSGDHLQAVSSTLARVVGIKPKGEHAERDRTRVFALPKGDE
jgi:hypothetical protein